MRLFIGIALNPSVRREAAEYARIFENSLSGAYVPAANYHVTLAFLGEFPAETVPQIRLCMNHAAQSAFPFTFSIDGTGIFGKERHGILHLTLQNESAFQQSARILRAALTASGFTFDPKPFRSHITLARKIRTPEAPDLPFPPAAVCTAHGFTLFHSTSVNDTLTYIPIGFSAFPYSV